ncbi:MAG: SO_0444 family Cu/Zn efflux transporter [FCB group bacterium]|jgi:uncharacterized membrane protein YraQ (UPF0718 family)/copper chaperone CopZ
MFVIDILKETVNLFLEMAPYLMLGLFFVLILNLFFTKELIIKHVGKNNFASVLKAAMLGVPLPLCSCGVIPSTIYMSKNGASKGATISFLISTPQTGVDSIIATYGMMGWIFAIFRPVVALIMGIIGGVAVGFVKDKPKIEDEPLIKINELHLSNVDLQPKETISEKILKSLKYSYIEFIDDIAVQFIVGLLISGMISYFIPEGFFKNTSVNNGLLGMLIMMAVGIPMYVCATASIPIAVTLMLKGFSPGVAFVFLVTGPATNAASIAIVSKALGKKVTTVYLAVIGICAIAFGYLLNYVYYLANIDAMTFLNEMHHHHHDDNSTDYLKLVLGIIFFVLILMSLYRKFIQTKLKGTKVDETKGTKINIDGMTCNHCVMNVKNTISGISGVTDVEVSLNDKAAIVQGNFNIIDLTKAVEEIGYKVVN